MTKHLESIVPYIAKCLLVLIIIAIFTTAMAQGEGTFAKDLEKVARNGDADAQYNLGLL